MTAPIRLPLVRNLDPPVPGDVIVSFSVAPSGDAVTMWSTASGRTRIAGAPPVDRRCSEEHPVEVRVTWDSPRTRRKSWQLSVTSAFSVPT